MSTYTFPVKLTVESRREVTAFERRLAAMTYSRCFYCDRVSRNDKEFVIERATGLLCCRECRDYNRAVKAQDRKRARR